MPRPLLLIALLAAVLLLGGLVLFATPLASTRGAPELTTGGDPAAAATAPTAHPHGDATSATAAPTDSVAGEDGATRAASAAPPSAHRRALAGITLSGTITDAAGNPVRRGKLVLLDDQGRVHVARLRGRADYTLPDVAPGQWLASVLAPGYVDHESELELSSAIDSARHDVVLPAGRFDVRLETARGEPLTDVIAKELPGRRIDLGIVPTWDRATAVSEAASTAGVCYDQRGAPGVASERSIVATVELDGLPPVYVNAVLRGRVLASVHVPRATEQVVLVLPFERVRRELASLRVRFVDGDTGQPLHGAALVLVDREPEARRGPSELTDRDGRIDLVDQLTGQWSMELATRGYESYRQPIQLVPGQLLDLGTVHVARRAAVAGRVLDADGEPARAKLVCRPTGRPLEPSEAATVRTRRNGSYRFDDLGRGPHVIEATASGHAPARRHVDTSQGGVDGADLLLRRGVQVTVDHRIEESGRFRLELVDTAGWVVHAEAVRSFSWPWRVRVTAGSYVLRVLDRGALRDSIPVQVGSEPVLHQIAVE
ncbi:MAG: carboxypeptidase-like regulatory domain-containing protein [Planctomycetota bacterium]